MHPMWWERGKCGACSSPMWRSFSDLVCFKPGGQNSSEWGWFFCNLVIWLYENWWLGFLGRICELPWVTWFARKQWTFHQVRIPLPVLLAKAQILVLNFHKQVLSSRGASSSWQPPEKLETTIILLILFRIVLYWQDRLSTALTQLMALVKSG